MSARTGSSGPQSMFRAFDRAILLAIACVVFLPLGASAQSVIAGQVKDESGAVLPGVTVEVSSPALIEKVRSVTTDERGEYKIVDLRPGQYTVSFRLEGFSLVKREGLDLPASFTATVNAELKVGSLTETLTVSGQTPVVDVQQVAKSTVLSRSLIDALPTSRHIMTIGQLIPGLRQAVADVGGSRLMEQSNMFGHGVNGRNTAYYMDGLRLNANKSEGGIIQYQNDTLTSEVVVTTSASPAEVAVAGVAVNTIPKDGGNTFSGAAFLGYTDGKWMSDKTDYMRKRGIRSGNNISRIDNDLFGMGGPIRHDRLWFFTGAGFTKADENVANVPNPLILPDGTKYNTTNDQIVANVFLRLTSQVTPRNKLAASAQKTPKRKGESFGAGVDPYYGGQQWDFKHLNYSWGTLKWTSAATSRLLLEAGYAYNTIYYRVDMHPWAEQPKYLPSGQVNPAWIANAPSTDTALNKNPKCLLPDGCTTWGSFGQQMGEYARQDVYAASVSYVTGSHSFKTGFSTSRGPYKRQVQRQADLVQNYVAGVPSTVSVYNTPIDVTEFLDYSLGFFVQDSWTVKRLTVNPGVRVEYFSSGIREAGLPPGRFRPAITFPELKNMPPHWKNDPAPRLSAAYDLFGDGKTALKASIGKYYLWYATQFAETYSPATQVSESRNWFDADLTPGTSTRSGINLPTNGDGIAQDNEIGPSANPSFGLVSADRTFDPNIQKLYSWETTASIQRQLRPGMSVTFGYFHRSWRNLFVTDRTLISNSDYTPFQVKVPDVSNDPEVAAVIDPNETLTLYNLNAAKRSVYGAALLDSNSTGALGQTGPDQSIYNGFETNFSARGANGQVITAGWTMDKNVTVFCDTNDNPNGQPEADIYIGTSASRGGRFCDQRAFHIPFQHQIKVSGSYPLPYRVSVAATVQSYPGLPRVVTWQPAASLFPGGRTNAQTIILTKPGSLFYPRYNQVDFNVKRTFKHGRTEMTAEFRLFNILNTGAIFAENNSVGSSLGQVQTILQGRMPQLGFQMKW